MLTLHFLNLGEQRTLMYLYFEQACGSSTPHGQAASSQGAPPEEQQAFVSAGFCRVS